MQFHSIKVLHSTQISYSMINKMFKPKNHHKNVTVIFI